YSGAYVADIRGDTPVLTAPTALNNYPKDYLVYRNRLYAAANSSTSITVYDVTTPTSPSALTPVTIPTGIVTGIAVADHGLIFTHWVSGTGPFNLYIAQLGASYDGGYTPQLIYTSNDPLMSPVVVGDTLYIIESEGLATFDLKPWLRSNGTALPTYINLEGSSNVGSYPDSYARLIVRGPWAWLRWQ